MKKFFALAMALLLALTVTIPASADLIFEPQNAFYERHRNECEYVNRSYIANGKNGYIYAYPAPGALIPEGIINGERIYISHSWVDQEDVAKTEWGVTQDGKWILMSDLALIYSWQEFEADFGEKFLEYDGSGDDIASACLYSYPGGVYSYTMEISDGGMDFSDALRYIYADANGLRWSYIGYYMGHRNSWICLDDPLNENLGIGEYLTVGQVRSGGGLIAPVQPPVVSEMPEIPEQEEVQESEQEILYPPAEKLPVSSALWVIPVVLIIVVAVVTALIIRKRKK